MRSAAVKSGDVEKMQAWAGQSSALASSKPAGELIGQLWDEARKILS
jgi:nitronate monooxygenase